MKGLVITIMSMPQSVQAAERCIRTGKKHGFDIEMFPAFTPEDDPEAMMVDQGIDPNGFYEIYSRPANCQAAFMSHRACWQKIVDDNEWCAVFEHDAVVINSLPPSIVNFGKVTNIGAPSYGSANQMPAMGVNPLTSKGYFPGAHAYLLKPTGARDLLRGSVGQRQAGPTDIFLNASKFPWLREYYPYCAEARDTFSTIQRQAGCVAKHNYGPEYKVMHVQ